MSKRKIFSCDVCTYASTQVGTLNRHKRIRHLGDQGLICDDCEHRSGQRSDLIVHISYKHMPLSTYKCPTCDYTSAQACVIRRHHADVHEKRKRLCGRCGKDWPVHNWKRHTSICAHRMILVEAEEDTPETIEQQESIIARPRRSIKEGKDMGFLRWPGLYITDRRMVAEILIDLRSDDGEIFRTEEQNVGGRGIGLFAEKDVSVGRAVCSYQGPVINAELAKERAEIYPESTSYMVEFYLPGKRGDKRKDDKALRFFDGTNHKLLGVMANHCACGIRRNMVPKVLCFQDKSFKLVFIANRDIKKGEELCWNYGDNESEAEFLRSENCCKDMDK